MTPDYIIFAPIGVTRCGGGMSQFGKRVLSLPSVLCGPEAAGAVASYSGPVFSSWLHRLSARILTELVPGFAPNSTGRMTDPDLSSDFELVKRATARWRRLEIYDILKMIEA
jgi:hypothetical protein